MACDFLGDAVELERGPSAAQVGNFEIAPADAALPTRADGLHAGFFGGKPGGISLVAIRLALYICDLGARVNALDEASAVALDGCADAIDFRQVDADSNDHNSAPVEVMVRRPCLTPLVAMSASAIFFTARTLPFTTRTSRQLS